MMMAILYINTYRNLASGSTENQIQSILQMNQAQHPHTALTKMSCSTTTSDA